VCLQKEANRFEYKITSRILVCLQKEAKADLNLKLLQGFAV